MESIEAIAKRYQNIYEDLSKVNIVRDDFHGEWNYTISQV